MFERLRKKKQDTRPQPQAEPERFVPTFTIGDEAPLYPHQPEAEAEIPEAEQTPKTAAEKTEPIRFEIVEEPEFFVPEEDEPAKEVASAAEPGPEKSEDELAVDAIVAWADEENRRREEQSREQIDFEHLFREDEPETEEPTPEEIPSPDEKKPKKEKERANARNKEKKPKKEAKERTRKESHTDPAVRKKKIRRSLIAAACCVLVVGGTVFAFGNLRAKRVILENLSYYRPEEIVEATGIGKNSFMPFLYLRTGSMRQTLTTRFPYISDVELSMELPGSAVLTLTEDAPLFYTVIEDEYFLISDNMRILGRYETKEELPAGVRELATSRISFAVVGYELRFFEDSYAEYIDDILLTIGRDELYPMITKIDATHRYNIILEYDERFTIEIGSGSDLTPKLQFVRGIIGELPKDATGTIHVTNLKSASVELDKKQ